jgi:hypothetical protein
MATTIFGTVTTGVTLTTAYQNPLSVTANSYVTNTAGGDAVYGNTAAAWTVSNLGTINGTGTSGTGILLRAGGNVTNGASGSTIGLIKGYFEGVVIEGSPGTVANFGTITSTRTNGAAIDLVAGGSVTNGQSGSAGGLIQSGGNDGVYVFTGAGTVTNFGTIQSNSSGAGVRFNIGGSVTNAISGLIEGGVGVETGIGVGTLAGAAGTVVNLGTIEASSSAFGAGVDLLEGGSVTNGGLDGRVDRGSAERGQHKRQPRHRRQFRDDRGHRD